MLVFSPSNLSNGSLCGGKMGVGLQRSGNKYYLRNIPAVSEQEVKSMRMRWLHRLTYIN